LAWHQTLSNVGLQQFVTEVAAPMTYWVGETWAQGDLAVHQEHLFTECLSVVMRQAMAAIPQVALGGAPKVLLTTFPQEAHGLGLLMVESLLTLQGCRCVSLGTQTPVRDIAQAAAAHQVDVVALSFSANMKPNHVVDGLAELQALYNAWNVEQATPIVADREKTAKKNGKGKPGRRPGKKPAAVPAEVAS
jgi:methanogenic corrinoid protein MtbC1